jgi:hypothetical protein
VREVVSAHLVGTHGDRDRAHAREVGFADCLAVQRDYGAVAAAGAGRYDLR